jgi:hypothetical protein
LPAQLSLFILIPLVTHGDVQEIAGFNAGQSVLAHKQRGCILCAILTQSLSDFGRDGFSGEK